MENPDVFPFIEALACGLDPVTGEALPEDSPLHHPQVIRALFAATRLMESQCASSSTDSNDLRPTRAGEPWYEHSFLAGESFSLIAETHQRSRGAIVSRLDRLGYLQRQPSTTDVSLPSQNLEPPQAKWWRKERPQAGKRWTSEEDAELRNYVANGLTTEEIARRLHRGDHGVDVRLSKLGLHSESKRE